MGEGPGGSRQRFDGQEPGVRHLECVRLTDGEAVSRLVPELFLQHASVERAFGDHHASNDLQGRDAPNDEQSANVKVLLSSYEIASTEYAEAGRGGSFSQQQYAQSQVSHAWQNYLDATASKNAAVKPIIDTIFKNALEAKN